MKDKELKPNANTVGVAPLGDPHFKEITKNTPTPNSNPNSKIHTLASDHSAITLIALVITIIVMLILVGVSVSIAINGGLFSTAKKATAETQYQEDREMLLSAVIGAIDNNAEVDYKELDANLPQGFTGTDGEYTSKDGNTFYVNKSGNIIKSVTVTVGTETVALTPDNVGEYLGKEVTNYKKDYNTKTTESITVDEKEYTVSTKYRLYYVDFDNKYGDGEGTIYLKADCASSNNYQLQTTIPPDTDVVKIKNLNPELYKNGNPPSEDNVNMQAVTWLTNTNNWNDLKPETFSDGITGQDINYIVGAPSLEMMMDSYNTHYKKDIENFSDTPDISTIPEGERRKLFYQYNSGDNGYKVGPCNEQNSEYSIYTSNNSVYTDAEIDSMYYPGNNNYYWLASPSDYADYSVMYVSFAHGGSVTGSFSDTGIKFCPLVSLKSSVKLKLK